MRIPPEWAGVGQSRPSEPSWSIQDFRAWEPGPDHGVGVQGIKTARSLLGPARKPEMNSALRPHSC